MKPVVTLTLNPSIDGASEAQTVRHTHKIRTSNERFDPGGGGINVARVVRELGGSSLALYLAGGATGGVLDQLIDDRGITRRRIDIHDHTRISHVVLERSSGREFRFVPEGPQLAAHECRACLAAVEQLDCDYLVASGSLPRGTPPDFYVKVAELVRAKGAKLVLDTSGAALRETLESGNVHLVKPSLGEFRALVGSNLENPDAVGRAAMALVDAGRAELVAVTMGHEGAILASAEGVLRRSVPDVEVQSAVGAGDSFVGAMTIALAGGRSPRDAFVYGMAAGTAAVLTPGTELCKRDDVERIFAQMQDPRS